MIKGQRFINAHPEEITVFAKATYLALTTLIGARTLGEEYVDLIYVNRSGKKLPRLLPRLGFILAYALVPYIVNKTIKYVQLKKERNLEDGKKADSWLMKFLSSYTGVLDTLLNLHIAIFYFKGEFYSISKRIFGLRYAFGHHKEPEKMQRGNYSLLGALMVIQIAVKSLMNLKEYSDGHINKEETIKEKSALNEKNDAKITSITQLSQLSDSFDSKYLIDLSDESRLPYLQNESRNCMLCLSPW